MKHFILIFGPPAVGKMTVGAALAGRTGLRLFHNHTSIELVLPFFSYDQPQFRLVHEFRRRIFEEVAASSLPGLIFTYVWALDQASDRRFVDDACAIFRASGARICFVELRAAIAQRLVRNASEFRLAQKPSKRDVAASETRMLSDLKRYQLNSSGDSPYPDDHLLIDNTDLGPEQAAALIARHFSIPAQGCAGTPA